jgi:hypothetical protein
MDTQHQPTIVATFRQCVVRKVTQPTRVQAWPDNVDEPTCALGFTTSQPKLSVRVVAAPCGFGVPTRSAGSA